MNYRSGINQHSGFKLSLCAAALTMAFPTFAQQAAPAADAGTQATAQKSNQIQEVVITASKRRESIQSVPMSVDALTSETLQKNNIQQFADVEKLSPGLVLNNADGRGQNISLRGVTFDPDTGASPTVQVYWNETPISTSDAFRSLFDIGRIEVLRGPQGTLRGETSPAGAITVATRVPNLDSVEGTINQTWGSHKLWNTQAAVNVPLIEGKLAMRVAAVYDRSSNDVHNVVNGRDNGDRARGGRVSLLYQPFKNLEVLLVHQQLKDENTNYPVNTGAPVAGQGSGPTLTQGDRSSVVEGNYDFYNRTKLTSLNVTWNLDGHKLSYIGGFQQSREVDDRDQDITNVIQNYVSQQLVNIKGLQRTHEVRIESTDGSFWNYMFGLYYSKSSFSSRFTQPLAYFFPVPYGAPMTIQLEGYTAPGTYGKGTAFFTDHRFALSANDTLEVGARHQKNESYSQQYLNVFGNTVESLPKGFANQESKHWTGSASYKHTFNKDVMAYVSYAGGYRPGGAAGFVTAVGLDPNYIVYKPEKSNSIELGVKSAFLNRTVTLNADIFQQKIKNYIGRANNVYVRTAAVAGEGPGPGAGGTYPADAATGGINLNTNGDVIARGLEATANWRINPDWRAQLSLSYVDAHYDNANLYCNDTNNDGKPDNLGFAVQPGRQISLCRSSRPLADTSENEAGRLNAVLQSEYTHPIANYEGFVRGLIRYTPPSYHLPTSENIPSFIPVDLYVGMRDSERRWEISLWAQNLLDRSNKGSGSLNYVGGIPGGYLISRVPQQRRVGVTLRYDFGM